MKTKESTQFDIPRAANYRYIAVDTELIVGGRMHGTKAPENAAERYGRTMIVDVLDEPPISIQPQPPELMQQSFKIRREEYLQESLYLRNDERRIVTTWSYWRNQAIPNEDAMSLIFSLALRGGEELKKEREYR